MSDFQSKGPTRQAARSLFALVAALGRQIGGLRPRRYTYSLGQYAFPRGSMSEQDWRWVRSRWGDELWLNPYYLIDRSIIAFGSYDDILHRFLEQRVANGMVCFDVGANIGVTTVQLARKVGGSGRVHAFEPIDWLCDRLEGNLTRNAAARRVKINRAALSNTVANVEIWAGTTVEVNQGMASIMLGRCDKLTECLSIPTTTLDAYVDEQHITRIDLIKVDVQGAEIRVIKGGRRTLAEMSPDLLLEVSPGDLAAENATSRDLLREVAQLGYRIHTLDRRGIGPAIAIDSMRADFGASNVLCTKRGPL